MAYPSMKGLPVCLGLAACASYEPQPLDPAQEVKRVIAELSASRDDVSLPEAVQLLLRHNSSVVTAVGHWREQNALAEVATPLPNPSLSIGPSYLTGATWGFEAGLGWVLPAFGKRAILDERDAANAEAARVTAIATAREEYLHLRADLLGVVLLSDREVLERANMTVLQGIVEGQRRLGANATISALDLRLLELEWRTLESVRLGTAAAVIAARGIPAVRCGVDPGRVAKLPMQARPVLPKELPSIAELRAVVAEHPVLVRLRARYEVAELQLRLEVRRQYPDLEIGAGARARERWIQVRVAPGVSACRSSTATKGRSRRRTPPAKRFVPSTARWRDGQLNRITVVHEALGVQHARYGVFSTQVAEVAASAKDLIEISVRTGRLNATDRALALRKIYAAELGLIEARANLYTEWMRLEAACGAPLLRFPGQPRAPSQLPTGAEVR